MAIKVFHNKDVNHIMDKKPFQQFSWIHSFVLSENQINYHNEVDNFYGTHQIVTMNYEASFLYWIVTLSRQDFRPTLVVLCWNNIIKWIFSYQQISTHFYDNFVWTLTIACLLSALYWHLPSYGYKDDSNRKQMKNWVWQPPAITKNAICWTQ